MGATDPFGWVGATLEGKVRIEAVVGEGGFGIVYRGHHVSFDEPVAVKCLKVPAAMTGAERDKFHKTFLEEGRLLHRLSKATAGIVQALDLGTVTSPNGTWTPYLVLEWLHGSSLDVDLAARSERGEGGRSLVEAIALLEPAARALDAAHAQGVAHRDIKPANLFLARIGDRRTIKVLDFGIAKVLGEVASVTQALAETGGSVKAFTPQYGAPEQFHRKFGATGPWTDVFALTLVLVELVSGKTALDGGDTTQLFIVSTDPTHRPTLRASGVDVPDAVEEVVRRALAVEPRERYRSAGELWDALLAALPPELAAARAERRLADETSARGETKTGKPQLSNELAAMATAEYLQHDGAAPERAASDAGSAAGGEGAAPSVPATEAAPSPSQRARAGLAATELSPGPPLATEPRATETQIRSPATTGPVLLAAEPVAPAPIAAVAAPRSRTGLWIGASVVGLGAMAAGFLLFAKAPPPPPPPTQRDPSAAGESAPTAEEVQAPTVTASAGNAAPSASAGALAPPTWGAPIAAQTVPLVPAFDPSKPMDHANLLGWAQGAFGYCQSPTDGGPRVCLFRKPDESTVVLDVDKTRPAIAPVVWPYGDELFLTWTVVQGGDRPPKASVLRVGARVRGEPGTYPVVIGGSKPEHRDVHPEAIALSPDGQYLGVVGHAHGEGVRDELYVHVVGMRELAGRAYNDAGFAHHKKAEYERAAGLFHKAAFADPKHPNAMYNLACAWARLGDARAAAALAQAVERDPDATKRKAKTDADFESVRSEAWFSRLVGAADKPAPK